MPLITSKVVSLPNTQAGPLFPNFKSHLINEKDSSHNPRKGMKIQED